MTPLPRIVVGSEEDDIAEALAAFQEVVVRHPVAAQAFCKALAAEGRSFAQTPEGEEWKQRIEGSELVRRARLVWEASSLWMFEEDPQGLLPSTWLDALFMSAARPDLELILDRLFREGLDGRSPR